MALWCPCAVGELLILEPQGVRSGFPSSRLFVFAGLSLAWEQVLKKDFAPKVL